MAILQYNPTSAGGRGGSVSDFADCTRACASTKPSPAFASTGQKRGGRNNQGVICVRFRGGRAKRMYRIIDFR